VKVGYKKDFFYVKDLRIIKNVDLKDMTIIDNSVLSFAYHLDNGIPIVPFTNDMNDKELVFLTYYLSSISSAEDLRIPNKNNFKMNFFLNAAVVESREEKIAQNETSKTTNSQTNTFELKVCVVSEKDENEQTTQTHPGGFAINICPVISEEDTNNNQEMEIKAKSSKALTQANPPGVNRLLVPFGRNDKKRKSVVQDQLFSNLDDLKKNINFLFKK
jgi:hypothetical protein